MSNYQCNVYQVKVVITLAWNGKGCPEYTKEEKVLAVSEEAAIKKVELALKWDLKELLKDGYTSTHEAKLLLENVKY